MHDAPTGAAPSTAFAKTLRWWDGIAITLSLPAALFVSLGTSIGAVGTWAALILWSLIALVAALHNWIYSELGAMFATKSGGIALYANEAWGSRVPGFGPLATYAYWFAWATAPAIWGLTVAQILTEQFWPTTHFSLSLGFLHLDVPQLAALAVAFISWALSMIQLRFTMIIITGAGVLLMIPALIFAGSVFGSHAWSVQSFTWRLGGGLTGLRTAVAWLFVMAWSSYAVEAAASFIPEFRDMVGDTRKSLRIAALILLLVFTLTPLGIAGLVGEKLMGDMPNGYLQAGTLVLFGDGAALMTCILISGVLVLSVMGTADAGRALYQSSRDGLTLRQFGVLNKSGLPVRAVTVQLAINVALVLFVGNALAVIVAGNVGYILAHLLAVSGFLVLRKDQPQMNRPIRLGGQWVGVAIGLTIFDALILMVGITGASITGYGGFKEIVIAVAVLAVSQLFYWMRHAQDQAKPAPAGLHP